MKEKMSRKGTYELVLRRAEDYRKASRQGRSEILDSLERDTGYDRKTLIRLMKKARLEPERLRNVIGGKAKSLGHDARGRPRKYPPVIGDILWDIRENYSPRSSPLLLCSYIRKNMDKLVQAKVIPPDPEVKGYLMDISPSTVYRLLSHRERIGWPWLVIPRGKGGRRRKRFPYAVDVQREPGPGNVQADTAEHCGGNHAGNFGRTLTIVDLEVGWVLLSATLGASARDFKEMISRSFQRYPVRIKSLQIDGGPEFANSILEEYAKQRGIELLSSRPYHKNDQAHVEERQLHVVRSFVGRDRIDTQAEIEVLGWLYRNLELLLNLFTPRLMAKAIVETETGRRKRIYDEPKTPLERLLPYLPEDKARELVELRDSLNPVFLMKEINRARKTLYELMREKGSRVGTLPLARRGSKKH